ncbi:MULTISPECIES: NmrA family protein [unclassified Nocardioides]|uniref:NmrA family protein n=1 Tax=unclassified Nocardioides TaxID=2615069 RepID=UPI00005718B4|nr:MULTISPECIES: NmrA family protein [unclassified Nocardioides]ABL81363.1 NmrA family protein [Nocardioides sp. JS614]
MSAPILVLGATGKTGAPVVAELARRGAAHRAAKRRPLGEHDVLFDWDDPETWAAAAAEVETVYLVKPPLGPVVPVTEFFQRAPWVSRVVLLSELGRETKPATDPERAVELVVSAEGRRATILRPNWFFDNFGPHGGWGPAIRDSDTIRIPSGDAPLAWIDVRDVAEVAVRALLGEDLGEVDLSGPEPLTVAELAAAIGEAAGREVTHDDPTLSAYREELEVAGTDPRRVEYLMDLVTDAARRQFARTTPDLDALLGHPPRQLGEYVTEHAAYWRENAA